MTLDACPDGPSLAAADDAEALRVATRAFTGPEPVVAVDDDGRVRFLRRDVTGAFVAVQERPPVAEALGLLPHPEGGWFRETWRTQARVDPPGYGGTRASATGIYFLLQPGEESVWHAVRSDEVWLWHRGGPLALVLAGAGDRPGEEQTIMLGPDVEGGQAPQALVPAGTWQAARPAGPEGVLVSCVVSPGFDFADFRAL
ncbi:cupin domain-containing protein [Microbispora sp. NPDC049125]|uniref:cupin domain-containing protein n=1 Tax=Microbispora sp. NPDC049125 TaxID=3154929 RepID=UPI003466616A